MLIIVVILWALLGLGVFFIAMHRGPRGARRSLYGEGRFTQGALALGILTLFVFGLVVPGFVVADNGLHKAKVAAGGVQLTSEQIKGRELFARSCVYCHTLAAVKSVGRIGPNLDVRVGDDIKEKSGRKALVLNAILEGRARGLGQMPAQLYQGKEAEEVASFVAAVAGHNESAR